MCLEFSTLCRPIIDTWRWVQVTKLLTNWKLWLWISKICFTKYVSNFKISYIHNSDRLTLRLSNYNWKALDNRWLNYQAGTLWGDYRAGWNVMRWETLTNALGSRDMGTILIFSAFSFHFFSWIIYYSKYSERIVRDDRFLMQSLKLKFFVVVNNINRTIDGPIVC